MKRETSRNRSVCLLVTALSILGLTQVPFAQAAATEDLEIEVQQTMERFQETHPQTAELFETAHGYMVFPRVEKGAAVVGGASGEGLAYEEGNLIGKATMTHYTLGLQVGGGNYSEVIFFENEAAMAPFKESETIGSRQATAFGPHDSLSANTTGRPGLSVFTLNNSGGFLGASAGLKKVTFLPSAR